MIKRTLHHLWGKKFIILLMLLVILLLPNTLTHALQVRTTTVITHMTIDATQPTIVITAEKFKLTPGSTDLKYEPVTYHGTDVRAMLDHVSLAHCTNIDFVGDPDDAMIKSLYNYKDLRSNTQINGEQTIEQYLKNRYCCYQ